ncbi:hypothetical protein Sjap_005141 [Stephania japonica]|uniref:Uncharacterized protein n=1 Tax=Stephania japonica TaxID=461633 RepID=A0AAP0PHL4_9MAGN
MASSSQYFSSGPFTVQQELVKACDLFMGCHHFPNVFTARLEHLIDEEELSSQPISDLVETVNAATLESVGFDEFSIMDEYLSEPEETLDVSLHKLDITIAQSIYDEVEKNIEVVSEKPEEPQKESKEDQP